MSGEPLSTDRLVLSAPATDDVAPLFAILGDPRTVEHNPSDLTPSLVDAEELVSRWIQHWEQNGFGYFCVRNVDSNELIGYTGVKNMTVHGEPVLNLVSRFTPDAWGNGYATEAAAAVVADIEARFPGRTILGRIRPENHASQNVAQKLGLKRDPEFDDMGEDGLDIAFTNRWRQQATLGLSRT